MSALARGEALEAEDGALQAIVGARRRLHRLRSGDLDRGGRGLRRRRQAAAGEAPLETLDEIGDAARRMTGRSLGGGGLRSGATEARGQSRGVSAGPPNAVSAGASGSAGSTGSSSDQVRRLERISPRPRNRFPQRLLERIGRVGRSGLAARGSASPTSWPASSGGRAGASGWMSRRRRRGASRIAAASSASSARRARKRSSQRSSSNAMAKTSTAPPAPMPSRLHSQRRRGGRQDRGKAGGADQVGEQAGGRDEGQEADCQAGQRRDRHAERIAAAAPEPAN